MTPNNELLTAEGTVALAIITLFLAAATVVLAIFTYKLWKATVDLGRDARTTSERQAKEVQESLRQNRELFVVDQRPWVSASSISPYRGLKAEEDSLILTLHFELKNTGKTPAIGTTIVCDTIVGTAGADIILRQEEVSSAIRRDWIRANQRQGGPGATLFPGDTMSYFVSTSIGKDALKKWTGDKDELPPLYIVGCIDYLYTFGPHEHHQTGFILELFAVAPDNPGKEVPIPRNFGKEFSSLNLRIRPSIASGITD